MSQFSISGYVALKYSHKELLERGIYGDCISQDRLDYALITSKPLTYNNIYLVFVHTASPSLVGRTTFITVFIQTKGASTHCENCWPL